MDIEEFVRRRLRKKIPEEVIIEEGVKIVMEFKKIDRQLAREFVEAVLKEVKTAESYRDLADPKLKYILDYRRSGVTMGEIGGGSRGEGDFFLHQQIGKIIESTGQRTVIDSRDQDDGGVVEAKGKYIVATIDGTHSRLSEFPFLAGFHVTRACLRDVYVMGAEPVALLSDVHLADDGDVSKILDFTAGICAVSESIGVPLVAGSTLRVGGDMVLGERMVSAVGAVGVLKEDIPTARRRAQVGDVILMTRGSGGGTIATTAIYHGMFSVVYETLNIDFLKACKRIFESDLLKYIHVMTDVTNGGLRGDAYEISRSAKVSLKFYKDKVLDLINPKVLEMLEKLNIDPLGVSIDSLLIIAPEEYAEEIEKKTGAKVVGEVKDGEGSYIVDGDRKIPLLPGFRESPYTPVKKVVDKMKPDREEFELMKRKIEEACSEAIKKKEFVKSLLSR